jgi:hypothetical protein
MLAIWGRVVSWFKFIGKMQTKNKRILARVLILIGVSIAVGVGVTLYLWNKPHRDIQAEEVSVAITAQALLDAYTADQEAANTKFLDQVVEVKGVINEVDENHITLDPGIYCTMEEGFNGAGFTAGQRIAIKGRVVSFDELFGEVRVDKAAVVGQ